jgi:hypothetical protein
MIQNHLSLLKESVKLYHAIFSTKDILKLNPGLTGLMYFPKLSIIPIFYYWTIKMAITWMTSLYFKI